MKARLSSHGGQRRAVGCLLWLVAAGALTAQPPPRLDVAFLIDTSRSIPTAQVSQAGALAVDLLRRLPAGSQLSVYRFDDTALLLSRTSDPATLDRAVQGLAARGDRTDLFDAIFDRARE